MDNNRHPAADDCDVAVERAANRLTRRVGIVRATLHRDDLGASEASEGRDLSAFELRTPPGRDGSSTANSSSPVHTNRNPRAPYALRIRDTQRSENAKFRGAKQHPSHQYLLAHANVLPRAANIATRGRPAHAT